MAHILPTKSRFLDRHSENPITPVPYLSLAHTHAPGSLARHHNKAVESPSRHLMNRTIRRPPPNLLAVKVQRNRTKE
jgi:hypothetical protein